MEAECGRSGGISFAVTVEEFSCRVLIIALGIQLGWRQVACLIAVVFEYVLASALHEAALYRIDFPRLVFPISFLLLFECSEALWCIQPVVGEAPIG